MAVKFVISFDKKKRQIPYYPGDNNEFYNQCENYTFKDTLTYSGFTRGRSSLNIKWISSSTGYTYYSGMSLLNDVLSGESKLERWFCSTNNDLRICGSFTFKKQGTAILLIPL